MKKQAKKAKADKSKTISRKGKMGSAKTALKAKAGGKEPKEAVAASPVPEKPPKTLKLSKEDSTKFRKLVLDLRDHLIDGVSFLATDNLKRSHRDASGELSGYSLHMADAGTDTFDREFALSLVSN